MRRRKGEKMPSKLYSIWRCMRYRCNSDSPRNHYASRYRDRGIKVCNEWDTSFDDFKEWAMNHGYQEGLTIDRIDADGDYEPCNCRWVTKSENSKGSRGTKSITHADHVTKSGVSISALSQSEAESLTRLTDILSKLSADGLKRLGDIALGMAIQKEIESEKPKR